VGIDHLYLLSISKYIKFPGENYPIIKKRHTKSSSHLQGRFEPIIKLTLVLAINHNITPKTIAAEIGLITLIHHRGSFSEDNRKLITMPNIKANIRMEAMP